MKKFIGLLLVFAMSTSLCFAERVEYVKYNPSSCVYHKMNCPYVKSSKKCIVIDKKVARQRGGRPCKKCGG